MLQFAKRCKHPTNLPQDSILVQFLYSNISQLKLLCPFAACHQSEKENEPIDHSLDNRLQLCGCDLKKYIPS